MNLIAAQYKEWVKSEPFDIGITTREALEPLLGVDDVTDLCRVAKFRAYMSNRDSASNGCMMRSTPIAVWGAGLSNKEFRDLTKSEVQLTHPNQTAADAVYIYNFAIKFLLENKDDGDKAGKCFEACQKEASKFKIQISGGY